MLQDDFCIGTGDEVGPLGLEPGAQFQIIIELAIIRDYSGVFEHRLMTGSAFVDDAQAPMAQANGPV